MKFDLHSHTLKSDGTKTPTEQIEILTTQAQNNLFSITDHYTIEAYLDPKVNSHPKIITGVELEVMFQDTRIEILLYNYDVEKLKLEPIVSKELARKNQEETFTDLVSKVKKFDLRCDRTELGNNKYAMIAMYNELVSHPSNLEIVPDLLSSEPTFFVSVQHPNHPLHTPKLVENLPSINDILELRDRVGGTLFLAHPYKYNLPTSTFKDLLVTCQMYLDGIECLHPSATEEKSIILLDFCKKYKLQASGGSDWHGKQLYLGTPNLHLARLTKYAHLFDWINE